MMQRRKVLNPFKRSIRAQLILGVALVHAVLMTFFVWDLVHKQEKVLYEQVADSTRDFARTFAHGISLWLAAHDLQAVQDMLDNSVEQLQDLSTVVVFDTHGQVVAHSDPAYVGRYVNDVLSQRLLKGESDNYQVLYRSDRWLDVAMPVRLRGELLGWVRIQRDLSGLAAQQRHIIWEGVLYTLFAIVVGSLLAWWLGQRLTYRLNRLTAVTRRIARGEHDVEVPAETDHADELTALSRNFAVMLEELRRHERQYVAERDRLTAILAALPEAVVEVDGQGRIVYANPMFEQLAHTPTVRLKNTRLTDVIDVRDMEGGAVWPDEQAISKERDARKLQVRVRHAETGKESRMVLRIMPRADNGHDRHVVLLFEYISESQHLLEELAWQRDHDLLTKLHNRHALERHLQDQQLAARADGRPRYLVQFNLDHFRHVNDTAGYSVGDQILQEVAQVLYRALKDKAFLARLGGDDFVAVLKEVDSIETACALAGELIRSVEKYPFSWSGRQFVLSMSAGVAVMMPEHSPEEALLKLDYAVHQAKEAGDGECRVYREGQLDTASRFEQIGWLTELKRALKSDRFELFLQPVVPLSGSDRRVGEVLVRLRTEKGDLATPYHFLPVAERFGLMSALDLHIVGKALDWLRRHPDRLDQMNINLSGVLLQQAESRNALMRLVLAQPENVRRKLCFEVTETAAIYDISETADVLSQLRANGCRIAVDDFGSGYASFNYLKNLPVDCVKIDGAFVRDMNEDRVNFAMVKAITTVAHEMGIEVVAEFVESLDVARMLQGLGVEYAQGYYFSAPVSVNEVDDRLWDVKL